MLWVDPTLLIYGAIFLTQHQQLNIFLIIELFHISFFFYLYICSRNTHLFILFLLLQVKWAAYSEAHLHFLIFAFPICLFSVY